MNEDLYRTFTAEAVDQGILANFKEMLVKDIEDLEEDVEHLCEEEEKG